MSDKTPQPGEWWEYNGVRIYLAGKTTKGLLSCEYKDGTMAVLRQGDHWQHLADCTGFDWQPEKFPQWYIHKGVGFHGGGYLKRTGETEATHVLENGREQQFRWSVCQSETVDRGDWTQVTKEEAESHIWNLQPAESPDDWVVQDRVPRRFACDEFRWITKQGECSSWFSAHEGSVPASHGHVDQFGSRLEVRCRRKDLPPLPNKFATLANEIEQLRADVMRRCDELGVRLTELKEGGNG